MILGPFDREQRASFDETAFVAALSDRWRPIDQPRVMLDVGAHTGSSLVHFAKRGWQVFAFEPDPENRAALIRFSRGFSNVVVSDRAVSDVADREVTLYSSPVSSGISTLSPFHESHRPQHVVRTTTLSACTREWNISRVDFMKIDVEGLEMKVLNGFPWDTLTPQVVECEFEDAKSRLLGYTVGQLGAYLTERGYTVYASEWHPIVRYGIQHDWHRLTRFDPERLDPDAWGNLLAFREDPGVSVLAAVAATLLAERTEERRAQRDGSGGARARWSRLAHALRWRPRVVRAGIAAALVVASFALLPPAVAASIAVLTAALGVALWAKEVLERKFAELSAQRTVMLKDLQSSRGRIEALERALAKSYTANAAEFQPFERAIRAGDVEHLASIWGPRLGLGLSRSALFYMSHRIAVIESLCSGRLCAAIETATLRTMVASAVDGRRLDVLEIGTLFGVSVAAIYDICREKFDSATITVIDPFDGYYGDDREDIATGQTVTESQFRRNMKRTGVDGADLDVIRGYSSESSVVEKAGRRRYDVLYIDGDHTRAGVLRDFELYHDLVRGGGFVVFDDYGSAHWPEIKPAVDGHVMSREDLEFIGADYCTAVFRRRREAAGVSRSRA